jgi:1,4-dihydroxy-2-naphthoate polyprenyltransferase
MAEEAKLHRLNCHPPKWRIWVLATRPKTLVAAIVPVGIGIVLASESSPIHLLTAIVTILTAAMIQITCNFANDWLDFKKGTDRERIGPIRVSQAGYVTPQQIANATYLSIFICLLLGSYLVSVGGLPILIIGVFSLFFAILYTATSYSLSYLGLGEIFVLLFFGPIATCGTAYLFTNSFSCSAFFAGISCGLISSAILAANNLRDIESDKKSGKKTLAVRFGEKFARVQYCLFLLTANLLTLGIGIINHNYSGASAFSLLVAAPGIKKVLNGAKGLELIYVLEQTAKSLIFFGVLYILGRIVSSSSL